MTGRRARSRRWWKRLPRRRYAPDTIVRLLWNVEVGRDPDVVAAQVLRLTSQHRPHVVMLQEAKGYTKALRRGVPGYRLHAARGSAESANCTTLVRRDVPSKRVRALRLRHHWTGPKAGALHEGRTFLSVDLAKKWREVNVHRTRKDWGDGRAFVEEYDALKRLADRTNHRVLSIGGDQNTGTRPGPDQGPHTPAALARAIGADIATPSPGRVDYGLIRGARVVGVRTLRRPGGDHDPVLITTTIKETP